MKHFIREHEGDDLNRLLLSASRYPDIDVPFAVEQIVARRKIRDKLPTWYAGDELIFPAAIAAEQCSSEQTAAYKQRLVEDTAHVCDLTGGLGVDSFFLSRKAKRVTYIERMEKYCEAARHNFARLGARNIDVKEGDATSLLFSGLPPSIDVFYIDPSRRGGRGKRIFALRECEPDLTALLPSLLQRAPRVIAKLSPMMDLRQALSLLPGTTEAHVVSVRNDCKELLFVIERATSPGLLPVHCTHFTASGREESFSFNLQEEKDYPASRATGLQAYLYEPNASILKAGAFKSITALGVHKLHANTHLYTSPHLSDTFPGRRFVVEDVIPFGRRGCERLHQTVPRANIAVRNFPLTANELRRRTRIADGGETYLFAATLADGAGSLIVCRKAGD
jgi:hypothetical protein